MAVSFTKLKSGEWGLRSECSLAVGSQVQVKKANGTTQTKTVGKLVWSDGKHVYLYAIASGPRSGSNSGRARSRQQGNGCSDCKRLGHMCKQCTFDEFDN